MTSINENADKIKYTGFWSRVLAEIIDAIAFTLIAIVIVLPFALLSLYIGFNPDTLKSITMKQSIIKKIA